MNFAAANDHEEIIDILLDNELPIYRNQPYMTSAFQAANATDQLKVAEKILAVGADLNWLDFRKRTVMQITNLTAL